MNQQPWLATYRENGIPETINADAWPSVVHLLDDAMQRYADKPAFRSFGQTLTYAEVDRLSGAFCAWLQNTLGVKKRRSRRGDAAEPDGFPARLPRHHACRCRPGECQPDVHAARTRTPIERFGQRKPSSFSTVPRPHSPKWHHQQACVKTVITVRNPRRWHPGRTAAGAGGRCRAWPGASIDRFRPRVIHEGAVACRAQPVALNGDDLIFLQYTGGTTGLSKGASAVASQSGGQCASNSKQIVPSTTSGRGEEVIVTALPLYHIFALMVNFIGYFSVGAENWLVPNPARHGRFHRYA
jgi:long-chain acyl-CoA synthetase